MISHDAVKKARHQVANLLNCDSNEIFFTSGATESINFAIKGIISYSTNRSPHIITVKTEHPAVLDSFRLMERGGAKVTYLPVNPEGLIDLAEMESHISKDTILICVMLVNNETGVIQPIKKISEIAHRNDLIFMCDATQAVGKIPVDVNDYGIDILCFSGHKFYAPKGVGGIYLRSRRPFKPKIEPLFHGGGHERGMRSGTLNVPGIVGLGKAAEIAGDEMRSSSMRIKKLRDTLQKELLKIEQSTVTGNLENRIYSTLNMCFPGADADAIISSLKNIAISNGSACTANSIDPSHVLIAMGLSEAECFSSIRFSLGKFNTDEEIGIVINLFTETVKRLRNFQKA